MPTGHIPSVVRVQGPERMWGAAAVARERRKGILFLKAQSREDSPGRKLWLFLPSSASPKFGCRKSKREMHPSSGKIKTPKGPLELMRPPRPQVKGNRLRKSCGCRGWKEHSPGVERDTSAAFPPSTGFRICLPQDLHPDPQEAPGKPPATGIPSAFLPLC